jgi:hypothetical protein
MDPRQLRKDAALRRKLWRALAITAVVGVGLLLAYDYWLQQVVDAGVRNPGRGQSQLAVASALINLALVAVAVLLARYLLDWGRQTRSQGQWPPAGLEWPGQAPVRHGEEAQRVARQLRYAGIAALVLAAGLAAITVWRWLA